MPYRDAADAYWSAGWRGILPLPFKHKANPPNGFTGAAGVWPSYADIQAWKDFPETRGGNISVRLPPHIIGIDVDAYGEKKGARTFGDACVRWGTLPPTWRTTSRDDGVSGILLFRVPEGLHWPGELGTDVELIQYRHRYAVVWPSIHPTGKMYRWIDPTGVASITPPRVDELPLLPEAWINGLSVPEQAGGDAPLNIGDPAAVEWLFAHNHGAPCPNMSEVATHYCDALHFGGSRHVVARDSTLRLIRLADEGHYGILPALGMVREQFLIVCADVSRGEIRRRDQAGKEWQTLVVGAVSRVVAQPMAQGATDPCRDPLAGLAASPRPEAEKPAGDGSGARGAADGPGAERPDPLAPLLAAERTRRLVRRTVDDEESTALFREPPTVMSLGEELDVDLGPLTFRVDQLFPTGSNVLLVANEEAGKTTLLNNLARSIVDGGLFLNHFAVKTGRVAIFNYEVSRRQFQVWLRETGFGNLTDVVPQTMRGFTLALTTPQGQEWAVRWLSDREIALWIIDPYARASVGSIDNENDNSQAGRFLDALDVIKERAGVADLIMAHHSGRTIAEEGMERARGAQRLDDWSDVKWLYTVENDTRFFKANGRDVHFAEHPIRWIAPTRSLAIDMTGGNRANERSTQIANIIVGIIGNRPGIGTNNLRAAVRTVRPAGNELIADALDYLVEKGKVIRRIGAPGKADAYSLAERVSDENSWQT